MQLGFMIRVTYNAVRFYDRVTFNAVRFYDKSII